jgi:hypothetical protein
MLPAPSTKLPPAVPVRRFRSECNGRNVGMPARSLPRLEIVKPASTPTRTGRERAVVGNVNTAAIGAAGEIHA